MTLSVESQKTVDAYLAALRKQLRELMDEDVNDIVEEIRAHILDKTSGEAPTGSVAETLAALGTPEELASRYQTEELLKRARMSRSAAYILHSLLRWATLSLVGLLVLTISSPATLWAEGFPSSPCSSSSTPIPPASTNSSQKIPGDSAYNRAGSWRRALTSCWDGGSCPSASSSAHCCSSTPSASDCGAFASSGPRAHGDRRAVVSRRAAWQPVVKIEFCQGTTSVVP